MERYIGLDVHATSCTFAVLSERGRCSPRPTGVSPCRTAPKDSSKPSCTHALTRHFNIGELPDASIRV